MVDTSATPARARPAPVTVSSWLLILFAAIQVINLILTLSVIGTIGDVLRDAYRGTAAEQAGDVAVGFAIGVGVLTVLLAVGLVVLALFNNRGRNGSRITTWVLGGILICCSGGSLVNNAVGGYTGGGRQTGNMPSGAEVQRRLQDALPSWYGPVTTLLGILGLLALLAALILLALPKSNEFFRKPQPGWGAPGAGYPPYPGYPHPQAPGYPPYPGAPGYPGAQGQPEPGWPQGPGQSGQPSPSSPWQQPMPPQPPGPPTPGSERPADGEGGPDRPGPNPPAGS